MASSFHAARIGVDLPYHRLLLLLSLCVTAE
jgi:hypothetical protein